MDERGSQCDERQREEKRLATALTPSPGFLHHSHSSIVPPHNPTHLTPRTRSLS